MSKTKNSFRNIIWGVFFKIISLVLPFISRTIIIYLIGVEYVGISSLFSSVLQILSLAELGVGTAILYSMYKPVALGDEKKVCQLLNFYRKVYRIIGLIILLLGIGCLFCLDFLITGEVPADVNIRIVFLVYLFNSVISYFMFSYTNVLFTAHMRDDVLYKADITVRILIEIVQDTALLVFRNYYAYIFLIPVGTMAYNLVSYYLARKTFPNITCEGDISGEEKKVLKKQVSGLLLGKLSVASRNSVDTVIISSFIGLRDVAVYGNYYLIMYSVFGIINYVSAGFRAAIGQKIATKSVKENYDDMMNLSLGYYIIYGTCTVIMLCVFQPFMEIWVGTDNMYSNLTVILLVIYFFLLSNVGIISQYWEAAGLFWENRWRFILETVVNIIVSILMVTLIGVNGVIIGTIVSILLLTNIIGIKIVFKYYFIGCSIRKYFVRQIIYVLITAVACILAAYCCSLISLTGVLGFIIKGIVSAIIGAGIILLCFCRTSSFKNVKDIFLLTMRRH